MSLSALLVSPLVYAIFCSRSLPGLTRQSMMLIHTLEQRYGLKMLVYFEEFDSPDTAIQREKNIKHWSRIWKLQLVESANPQWRDLYNDITR